MEINKIYTGDCLDKLKKLKANLVDAVVTDPPYGLEFMGKKWDYDVPSVDIWKECLRVLKPGGYLLSFAGTRTHHRIACAIEDAGFEIRDMIAWVYGSGFSKCTVWKEGAKRTSKSLNKENDLMVKNGWDGWGRGGLKPALEPITVARKPLSEKTVAENVLKWGTGGIAIDACRVEFQGEADYDESIGKNQHSKYKNSVMKNPAKNGIYSPDKRPPEDYKPTGRFPANLIHDGSDEVVGLFPDTKSPSTYKRKLEGFNKNSYGKGMGEEAGKDSLNYGDNGSASRFFQKCEFTQDEQAQRFAYIPKASKSERNKGCEGLEEKVRVRQGLAGEKKDTISTNSHPTVKPIALMEYLVKLVSKEGAIVLDPFAGSGSTLIACQNLKRNYIGIEKEKDYVKIAEARLKIKLRQNTLDI